MARIVLAGRLLFAAGAYLPKRVADGAAWALGIVLAPLPLPAVAAWAETVELATGQRPGLRGRARLLQSWCRNLAWSLSLPRWSDELVLRTASISDVDLAKLRSSLEGTGLVLALPHMGSWDFAGAWCARVGITAVSVAERLPRGMFECFREAREAMGMRIYALDEPGLLGILVSEVRERNAVCLLSDRDLSSRGLQVAWPGSGRQVAVPSGPALLARRTGADLRIVSCRFDGPRLRMEVSDPISGSSVRELMEKVVDGFAQAVRRNPSDWLVLRRIFL